jgi:hypothetical protein
MEGITSIGEFLHVDWIVLDFSDNRIRPILEDVNNIR